MNDYMEILRQNAILCVEETKVSSYQRLAALPSHPSSSNIDDLTTQSADEDDRILVAVEPSAAMYVMIEVRVEKLDDSITDDAVFARRLLEEENVFVLPGKCFTMDNFFRLVICPPREVLQEAFQRMHAFCERHRKKSPYHPVTSTSSDIATDEPASKKVKY